MALWGGNRAKSSAGVEQSTPALLLFGSLDGWLSVRAQRVQKYPR